MMTRTKTTNTPTTPTATRPTTKTTTISDAASAESDWRPDLLDGFEQTTIPLGSGILPGEVGLRATLVRRTLDADPKRDRRERAVISLPGWNDYFFHTHVAAFFEAQGITFYALDPRRSGRSLGDPARRDYAGSLGDHAEELDAAYEFVSARHASVVLMGHSTGGLIAALWASDRPGRLAGLVLNSPWLAMWGPPGYPTALLPTLTALTSRDPLWELPLPDPGDRYASCVHASGAGEWDYDRDLKASGRVPVRAGWLRAVLLAQRRTASGLAIDAPVFMAAGTRSHLRARGYSERARRSDIVLDVDAIAARAPKLGRSVTLVRIADGFHDLTLSVPDARKAYFAELARWLAAYVPPQGSADRRE